MLTTKDICNMLHVVPNTVKMLIRTGALQAIRVGHQYRFRQADVEEFIKKNETQQAR